MILSGRMLNYYERKPMSDKDVSKPRKALELKPNTIVMPLSDTSEQKFAFDVIPDGDLQLNEELRTKDSDTMVTGGVVNSLLRRLSSTCASEQTVAGVGSDAFTVVSNGSEQLSGTYVPIRRKSSIVSTVLGRGKEPVWRFQAKTEAERRKWIAVIRRSVALIKRVEVGPTLAGVGQVHDHYKVLDVIGQGRFGEVREAIATHTGEVYAIKVINKDKMVKMEETAKKLRNEIRIMRRVTRKLNHANICKLFQAFEDTFMVYLVMERLVGIDLLEGVVNVARFDSSGHYTESNVADLVAQIAAALKELHGAQIILRDLKPENLLFTDDSCKVIKVADFGSAMILSARGRTGSTKDASSTATVSKGHNHVGTPGFLSPEVISEGLYSPSCDMWALGCILFILLVGYPPFVGQTPGDIMLSTLKGLQPKRLHREDWKRISSEARSILGSMLTLDPRKRMAAGQVPEHPWFKRSVDAAEPLPETFKRLKRLNAKRKEKNEMRLRFAMDDPRVMLSKPFAYVGPSQVFRSPEVPDNQGQNVDERLAEKRVVDAAQTIGSGQRKGPMKRGNNWSTSDLVISEQPVLGETVNRNPNPDTANAERLEVDPGLNGHAGDDKMYKDSSVLLLDVYAQQVREKKQSEPTESRDYEGADGGSTFHANNTANHSDDETQLGQDRFRMRRRDPGRFLNLLEQKLQEAAEMTEDHTTGEVPPGMAHINGDASTTAPVSTS